LGVTQQTPAFAAVGEQPTTPGLTAERDATQPSTWVSEELTVNSGLTLPSEFNGLTSSICVPSALAVDVAGGAVVDGAVFEGSALPRLFIRYT
jgi:hypothetical protein